MARGGGCQSARGRYLPSDPFEAVVDLCTARTNGPDLWDDPYRFVPEPFLDAAVLPKRPMIPQGGGPRGGDRCPGEDVTVAVLRGRQPARTAFTVPELDLRIPIHRLLTRPRSGFRVRGRHESSVTVRGGTRPGLAPILPAEPCRGLLAPAGPLGVQQLDQSGSVHTGDAFEQVGVAQQRGGLAVVNAGPDQAEAAGLATMPGRGQGLMSALGQSRVGKETGGPADDRLVDPRPPGGVVGTRVVSGEPVQSPGSTGAQQMKQLDVHIRGIAQVGGEHGGLPGLGFGQGSTERARRRRERGQEPAGAGGYDRRQIG